MRAITTNNIAWELFARLNMASVLQLNILNYSKLQPFVPSIFVFLNQVGANMWFVGLHLALDVLRLVIWGNHHGDKFTIFICT